MNPSDRVVAVVPGSVCAAFALMLEELVRERLRRDGGEMPRQLGVLLDELRETGEAWRTLGAPTSDATSDAGAEDFRHGTLDVVSTRTAAEIIGTSTRNVVDLIDRGRIRAEPPLKGRAWRIDRSSVLEYLKEKASA
jgi:excisionase family DNA binding protein